MRSAMVLRCRWALWPAQLSNGLIEHFPMLTKPGSLSSRRKREALRRTFLPQQVCLLFIGESPPASGRFFYSANSGLYRAMRSAFEAADARITDDNFLSMFRAYGCYLTDLSHQPLDNLKPPQRRAMRTRGEAFLAGELRRLQPGMIAPVLRS